MRQPFATKTANVPAITALCLVGFVLIATAARLGWAAGADKDADGGGSTSTPKVGEQGPKDAEQGSKDDEVTLSAEAVKRYGITCATAKRRKLNAHLIAPARLSFDATATAVVGSAVQGRVKELRVVVGDVVKRGDEVLVVESPELGEAQSDHLQKRAALAGASALIDPTKGAAERAKELFQQSQGISLTDLQKREMEYATAQNNLLVAQAAFDAARSKLDLLGFDDKAVEAMEKTGKIDPRFSVRSPIDGTVTERLVTPGELVKPDREKLLVISDMSALWALADVPESRLADVRIGGKASVMVPAAGDRPFEGTVMKVAPVVDPQTRTVRVQIDIKGDPALKPGMFAEADLPSRVTGDNGEATVLAVPSGAVTTLDGSTTVFVPVKGEPNAFAKRLVSVGASTGGMVVIVSGLDEGERVVTAGTSILKAEAGKNSAKDDD